LNVVMPAHINGAASSADSPSGSAATALAGAIVYSAKPPLYVTPVTCAVRQAKKLPRRQGSHWPQ
jgi:hypothetical protein